VKWPVSRCLIAILISNVVCALIASRFLGLMNFEEGMFVEGASTPIGAVLQEPPLICRPFVRGILMSTVRQKLMKLFLDVRDGSWPEVTFGDPSCSKLVEMTRGSNARREI